MPDALDGPMTFRKHVLSNSLLIRAIHDLNEACEQNNIDAIYQAIDEFHGAIAYLPENMPMHVLTTHLSHYNQMYANYGHDPEIFDNEYREFHQLLRDELNNRD